MKKVWKLLATLALLLWFVADARMDAQAEAYGNYSYTELEDGTVEITGYKGEDEVIVTPAEISGKRVSSIGSYAFEGVYAPNVTKVEISEGVSEIGSCAFSSCSNLEEIILPESLRTIDVDAFSGCDSLDEIAIPAGVTSIEGTFSGCSNLTSINVDAKNNAYRSEDGVLYNKEMSELLSCPAKYSKTVFNIPASVAEVQDNAFYGCSNLEKINIPAGVTNVGWLPFLYCNNLSRIEVDENNSTYSSLNGVFYNKALTALIHFPQNHSATMYNIPASVTRIESRAFQNCSSLVEVAIPEGVTSLGDYIFAGCTNLTEITIPVGVQYIGYSMFSGCINLYKVTIPEGVQSIDEAAFSNCGSLTEVIIPESVTSIGWGAFSGCSSLTMITLPENLTRIMDSTFNGCCSLLAVTIPDSVIYIGGYAFSGCSSLREIIIPESVTEIQHHAFSGCSSLTEITIPENVTDIGWGAFSGCTSLSGINVDEENPAYSSQEGILYTKDMTGLLSYPCNHPQSTYSIPESVGYIWNEAFSGSSNLTNIYVGTGNSTFRSEESVLYNKEMTELICFPGKHPQNIYNIPEGIENIRNYAFSGCGSLMRVTIPKSVTFIGASAFYNCGSLKELVIPETVTMIGEHALETGCPIAVYLCGICYFENSYNADICREGSSVYIFKENWDRYADIREGREYITWVKWNGSLPDGVEASKPEDPGTSTPPQNTTTPNGSTALSVGETVQDAGTGASYKVLSQGAVQYVKPLNTSSTSITVPKEVVLEGVAYKVTTVAANAFKGNKKLKSVTIGNNVQKIAASTFSGCTKLKSVTIGTGVTEIGAKAFSKCTALAKITIPAKVSKIGKQAFGSCKKLKAITIKSKKLTAKSVAAKAFKGVPNSATVKVPKAKRAAYKKILRAKGLSAKVKIK